MCLLTKNPFASTLQTPCKQKAADLWSLGVILYCFVVGRLPFWAPSVIELGQQIRTATVPVAPLAELPPLVASLIQGLLCKDPAERATLTTVSENTWINRDGREPLILTTKETAEDVSTTAFDISAALSFAKIVRIKTRVRRLVSTARKRRAMDAKGDTTAAGSRPGCGFTGMRRKVNGDADAFGLVDRYGSFTRELVSPTSRGSLQRRSITTKSLIASGSLGSADQNISLTSYRSGMSVRGRSQASENGDDGNIGQDRALLSQRATKSDDKQAVESSEDVTSSDDDLGDEDVVAVDGMDDLETHLMKPRGRTRRRYSEVIPGRVQLAGMLTMREDCINQQLRLACSSYADINGKRSMEDRHLSIASVNEVIPLEVREIGSSKSGGGRGGGSSSKLEPSPPTAFFGVYDGHNGAECAEYIRINLHKHIFHNPAALMADPEATFKLAFANCDKRFLEGAGAANRDSESGQVNYSGSTATVCLVIGPKVWIAWVGDSRAVLARAGRAVDLSTDHMPTVQSETERIHRAGGSVVRGRVQGVLGVSRAFGDIEFKTLKEKSWGGAFSGDLVSVEPEVHSQMLVPEDEFIIIASDGLYDCFTSQRVVGRFKAHLKETEGDVPLAVRMLVQDAKEMRPGHDNITATAIVFFGAISGPEK